MDKYIEDINREIEKAYGGCGKEYREEDNIWVCGEKIGNTETRFYCANELCQPDDQKIKLLYARKQGYLDTYKKMANKFKIMKRSGELDVEIEDGRYKFEGDITLENGKIKYIDNGNWKRCALVSGDENGKH